MRVISSPLSMSSRARFHPTLPPPTIRTYISGLSCESVPVWAAVGAGWPGRSEGVGPRAHDRARTPPAGDRRPTQTGAGLQDGPLAGLEVEGLAEHVDRVLRGRDALHALLGVPRRAGRVHDAAQDAADVEPALGDLTDDDVGVVPVGGGDEAVGAVEAGFEQRVDLERGPDGEQPAAVLPCAVGTDVQALVRQRVLVEDRDLV